MTSIPPSTDSHPTADAPPVWRVASYIWSAAGDDGHGDDQLNQLVIEDYGTPHPGGPDSGMASRKLTIDATDDEFVEAIRQVIAETHEYETSEGDRPFARVEVRIRCEMLRERARKIRAAALREIEQDWRNYIVIQA